MKFDKIPVNFSFEEGQEMPEAFATEDGIVVVKSIDNTPKWGPLLHISVSKKDRLPTWDELVQVKEHFFGDVDCMMVLPKKEDYVNIHTYCFHIWKTPQEWGIQ